ncbi:hypothetical protein, partial [Gordonia sp. OPL2]|uniref:hypothetical protein n=1 Tax=Gordonia sp. OPL2 TaxID=2486274 RepID=UPI001CA3D7E6
VPKTSPIVPHIPNPATEAADSPTHRLADRAPDIADRAQNLADRAPGVPDRHPPPTTARIRVTSEHR